MAGHLVTFTVTACEYDFEQLFCASKFPSTVNTTLFVMCAESSSIFSIPHRRQQYSKKARLKQGRMQESRTDRDGTGLPSPGMSPLRISSK